MAFPVLTIVGERLELSRLVRKPSWAITALVSALGIYVLGLGSISWHLDRALRLQGIGLLLVALWLLPTSRGTP